MGVGVHAQSFHPPSVTDSHTMAKAEELSWDAANCKMEEGNIAEDRRPRDSSSKGSAEEEGIENEGEVIGSAALRPVFFGNLNTNYTPEEVTDIFEKPFQPRSDFKYDPIPVDRIDQKRGYCFVFLKDATTQADKERAERFLVDINGIEVPGVSNKIRAEFARGDGRIKRKEDERRKNIAPSETLFVVNFHEETTKREDLEMLFSPYGPLVRIDMKRNYAFVQFHSIENATKAKEGTNGGKLDQSVLTVEYVARQRSGEGGGGSRNRRGGRDSRRDDRRRDDRRRGGSYDRYDYDRRSGDDRRYESRRYDEGRHYRSRESPPPYRGRRSHSRSRSPPPRYRSSRSPPRGGGSSSRYDDRYDDYRDRRGPSPPPPRGRSLDRDRGADVDGYRGDRDKDRGYRGDR